MIVQVCRADGVVVGKFEEPAFQDKLRRGEFPVSGQYSYWHEGMTDWKPRKEYRPRGKITDLLWKFPTRDLIRQQLKSAISKSEASKGSVLKKAIEERISSQKGATSEPNQSSPLACNIEALSPDLRKRHFDELEPALLKLRKRTRELPNGYEFEFPADSRVYQLLTEWAFQERSCCPFFDIDLHLEKDGGPLWLRLTGRQGVKEFLKTAPAGWIAES